MDAFAATLEELHDADLLLHVVDASSPRMEEQMKAVDEILRKLDLDKIRRLLVLNKIDRLDPDQAAALSRRFDGIALSALNRRTFSGLLEEMERLIWPSFSSPSTATEPPSAK
jgi:GTPase